jgi:hypothetical protein
MPSSSPNRDTSERELHAFNQKLRQQPFVQQWLAQRGKVDTGQGIQLNDQERDQFTLMLRRNGVNVPGGMKVDGAGNFNQKNHLWRNVGIGAAAGGAAGAGAGAGAAGAGGTLASSSLPVASLMGGPAAITSAGVSGGLGAGMGAGLGAAGAGAAGAAGAMGGGAGAAGTAAAGGSALSSVLKGLKDYAPLALAGAGAIKGMTQGPPQAEQQLNEILKLAQGRIQASEPLFQALNHMAMSQMPNYTKGQK